MENWLKSVSAFANGTGGVLVFGEAADGTVAGAKNMESASEIIRLKIEEYIVPVPEVELKPQTSESGKRMLILEVAAGHETPYYYIGENMAKAYVRAAKESVPAGAQELKRLILKGRQLSYDSQISGYDFEKFSFLNFCVAYQEWTGDQMDDRRFEAFGMVKGGRLTAAGLLFADESPVRHSRLTCVRWKGVREEGGGEAAEMESYSGGLITLLNKGVWFIKQNMSVLWREAEGKKEELPDYSDRGMFEALVNAFAHRDYFMTGSEVRIDMFDDCLLVSSPGGMPDGSRIQEKDEGMVLSVRRNPVLADIFCCIGYMERQGRGLGRIKKSFEEIGNYSARKAPEFYSDKGQFTVILKNLNYHEKSAAVEKHAGENAGGGNSTDGGKKTEKSFNENERKVLTVLCKEPEISTDCISQQSGIAKRTVERTLQALKKKEAVVREGSRRSGRWRVLVEIK